jgi:NhaP-type Na+/H+ and K+/H+ antiporter
MSTLQKLGIGGLLGFLLGLATVWYVEPTTPGGTGLLLLICVSLGMLFWALLSAIRGWVKGSNAD